ncbi:MAG: hypothetical protein COA78_26055 [Blastopirellula sp.]|nr:MAG: hypothetical protein COA78_26055 [Blastopirellula sp.]
MGAVSDGSNQGDAHVIFLSMFLCGGGPYRIPGIIGVYDWINRSIPSKDDMENGLNTLLAMRLIKQQGDDFYIQKDQYIEYDVFQKKLRKNRFYTIKKYFEKLPDPNIVLKEIQLTEKEYKTYIDDYRNIF